MLLENVLKCVKENKIHQSDFCDVCFVCQEKLNYIYLLC